MELPDYSLVKNLVTKVKKEMFSSSSSKHDDDHDRVVVDDIYRLVSPSAYDTAWLAMVPNPRKPDQPLFRGCLHWLLRNQKPEGFWGTTESTAVRNLDSLTSTLACIVALTTWSTGHTAIQQGLGFIHANAEEILREQNGCFPTSFVLLFPAMVDLAKTKGLHVHFSNGSKELVQQVFRERQQLFQIINKYPRLGQKYYATFMMMPYLEALPETYTETLLQQNEDNYGILIQSPSASAYAYIKTGNNKFLANMNYVVQRCGYGVPAIYPMDEDLVKVCLVNRIVTLGLAEYFMEEITTLLDQVFRSYVKKGTEMTANGPLPLELYRDSLAFRLLRLHGYTVSPWKFCWFLQDEDILVHIEEHHEMFLSAMYNVYRASDLTFAGEILLQDARLFSRRILEKKTTNSETWVVDQIKHELSHPWLARLDHLEHRKCIEREETMHPWTGKAFSYRLSSSSDAMLQQLAIENYSLRQSIFRDELTELQRWSKDMGLCDMGFARQKTAYCYFAVASTVSSSSLSDVRLALVKSAILNTAADDFFDVEGSFSELRDLTNAVKIWQQKGLNGHSEIMFKALKHLLDDISMQIFNKHGYEANIYLQDLWHQTFVKWLKEAEWSRTGHMPPTDEYLQVATTSIAAQTIILPAALLLSPQLGMHILTCPQNEPLTNLLMVSTRLLNDIATYEREQEEGKPNLVLLNMMENPDLGVEESVEVIQKILDEKIKQFLELALVSGMSDIPEACKLLHFHCLKVFQMFYNSRNAFDSPTELLDDINKAIYFPLKVDRRISSASGPSQVGTRSLQIQGRVIGTSSTLSKSIIESRTCTTGTIGAVKFVERKKKPYAGMLSLTMRKSTTYTTFLKPKACTFGLRN